MPHVLTGARATCAATTIVSAWAFAIRGGAFATIALSGTSAVTIGAGAIRAWAVCPALLTLFHCTTARAVRSGAVRTSATLLVGGTIARTAFGIGRLGLRGEGRNRMATLAGVDRMTIRHRMSIRPDGNKKQN